MHGDGLGKPLPGMANPMGGCSNKKKGLTYNTTAQGQGSPTVSGEET